MAAKDVAKAQAVGVKGVAEQAQVNRGNFCRALSRKGKPQLETVSKMLSARGLRFTITPAQH